MQPDGSYCPASLVLPWTRSMEPKIAASMRVILSAGGGTLSSSSSPSRAKMCKCPPGSSSSYPPEKAPHTTRVNCAKSGIRSFGCCWILVVEGCLGVVAFLFKLVQVASVFPVAGGVGHLGAAHPVYLASTRRSCQWLVEQTAQSTRSPEAPRIPGCRHPQVHGLRNLRHRVPAPQGDDRLHGQSQ